MAIKRKVSIPGTVTTKADVLRFIENCFDLTMLRDINSVLVYRVKAMQTHRALTKIRDIKLGDTVRFSSRRTGCIQGKVVAVLRTKIKVSIHEPEAGRDVIWRVPASMVEHVT